MKGIDQKPIDELIKSAASRTERSEGAEFWAEFKARAKLTNQEEPSKSHLHAISIWSSGLAFATVLLVAGFFFLTSGSGVMATEVQYIDVEAEHSAVMILSSDPTQGTVVWIEGMTVDGTNGGGS